MLQPAALLPEATLVVSSAALASPPRNPSVPGIPLAKPTSAKPADKPAVPAARVEPARNEAENDKLAAKPSTAAKTVTYTLQIGEYVVPQAMRDAKRKIKNAGLQPEVEQGSKRKESMTRLSVGEYPSQGDAKKQLNKLRAAKINGFYLMEADQKYHVYVGSFSDEKSATKECERFSALGIKASLKHVIVAVPTLRLTAGIFPTRVEALAKAMELEKQGMKSVVIEHSSQQELP